MDAAPKLRGHVFHLSDLLPARAVDSPCEHLKGALSSPESGRARKIRDALGGTLHGVTRKASCGSRWHAVSSGASATLRKAWAPSLWNHQVEPLGDSAAVIRFVVP